MCSGVNKYPVRFAHFFSPLGVSGILRTGVVMPTSIQTLAEELGHQGGRFCPSGFFGGIYRGMGHRVKAQAPHFLCRTPQKHAQYRIYGGSKANASSLAGPTRLKSRPFVPLQRTGDGSCEVTALPLMGFSCSGGTQCVPQAHRSSVLIRREDCPDSSTARGGKHQPVTEAIGSPKPTVPVRATKHDNSSDHTFWPISFFHTFPLKGGACVCVGKLRDQRAHRSSSDPFPHARSDPFGCFPFWDLNSSTTLVDLGAPLKTETPRSAAHVSGASTIWVAKPRDSL